MCRKNVSGASPGSALRCLQHLPATRQLRKLTACKHQPKPNPQTFKISACVKNDWPAGSLGSFLHILSINFSKIIYLILFMNVLGALSIYKLRSLRIVASKVRSENLRDIPVSKNLCHGLS